MEYIFLICSAKRRSHAVHELISRIRAAATQTHSICLIRECRYPGDIESAVCRDAARGGAMRFYVYGSDADLCAAARVAIGFDNVEIGIIPDIHGSDFAHSYPGADFASPLAQIRSVSRDIDLIDCNGQCFIGSVRVCSAAHTLLHRPGTLQPPVSLAAVSDDGTRLIGSFASAGVGNGSYSGRQHMFRRADPSDGHLDLVLQRAIPPRGKPFPPIRQRFRRLTIIPYQPLYVCGDGQQFRALRLSFTAIPSCVRFLVPAERPRYASFT